MLSDYRNRLRRKGYHPVAPQRTVYAPGDKVLQSWARPISVVQADGTLVEETGR